MPDLIHPNGGEHTWASADTAKKLLDEGWELAPGHTISPAEDAEVDDVGHGQDEGGTEEPEVPPTPNNPAPDKPLDEMKLKELIEHAQKIGVPAEQLEPLSKPGASKAQAIEIINAHTAS